MVPEGNIAFGDMQLLQVVDDPAEVVQIIKSAHHRSRVLGDG